MPAPAELTAAIELPSLTPGWTGDPGHTARTAARLQGLLPDADIVLSASPSGLATWTERARRFLARC